MPERPDVRDGSAFSALRRFTRTAMRNAEERCDLCGEPLGPRHRHILNLSSRELLCACQACAILFGHTAEGGNVENARRLVPTRRGYLPDFEMTGAQWESLRLPVNMVFFSYNTAAGRVMALYPGPMGAAESLLTLETWQELVARNPILTTLEPDVEALLVNRVREAREYFLVPIDECYELIGLIRSHWKGLGGGQLVWKEIDRFYSALKERAHA